METTAVEETEDYPSSPGQLELGKVLMAEMKQIGLEDVGVHEGGVVMGTLSGNVAGAPTVAFLAHQDTSPDASGKDVKPNIIKDYDGKDITLPGDTSKVIKVDQFPQLKKLKGKTLITSDGTTLLGADDKAGIAAIMTAVVEMKADPSIKHGPIRVVFTCDEEVGRGCDKVDINKINATAAYTLDGEDEAGLENETFSADMATVTVTGFNIHPGFAYDKMVNAIRYAGEFLARMPKEMSPEMTQDREQFMHPYDLKGGVDQVTIKVLLRSFETPDLETQAATLKKIADSVMKDFPKVKIDIEVKKQYRNMLEHLEKEPRTCKLAEQAIKNAGLEVKYESIRGGTDGARLSEMGLPTPNLSTGMHNFHSSLEFACLEQMENAKKVIIELAKLWGEEKA